MPVRTMRTALTQPKHQSKVAQPRGWGRFGIPALPLLGRVAVGLSLNLPEPWRPQVRTGRHCCTDRTELSWEQSEGMPGTQDPVGACHLCPWGMAPWWVTQDRALVAQKGKIKEPDICFLEKLFEALGLSVKTRAK